MSAFMMNYYGEDLPFSGVRCWESSSRLIFLSEEALTLSPPFPMLSSACL